MNTNNYVTPEGYNWFYNQLSYDIWNKKYRHENETLDEWFERVSGKNKDLEQLIRKQKFLFGGRTLSNRGTKKGSYSNCYSEGYVDDSLIDIMKVATNLALTYKAQGGEGLSLSKIRPKGTRISTGYYSDGILPWMKLYNTVTDSISQGGSRKGALLMSLDITHKDAKTFITIKDNLEEIKKANLSVEINDEFMEHVINNTTSLDITKKYDSEEITYTINPVELYNLLIYQAWKSAEPGVIFTNKFKNYNLMEKVNDYIIESCNACSENPLIKYGSCNLASINLSEYVNNPFTENSQINWIELKKDIYLYIKEMDKTIDENLNNHPLNEQSLTVAKWRNLGLGTMGYADMLIKLGLIYGSQEAIDRTEKLYRFIFRQSVFASSKLAEELGSFPGYDKKIFDSEIIRYHFDKDEIKKLKKNGLRNASLLSIAPTGSIGTMFNVSTGIEPIFAFKHKRRTESLNDSEKSYDVNSKIIEDYYNVTGCSNLPEYFVASYNIHWTEKLATLGKIQLSVDTAISSTTNLPENTTLDEIKNLYISAWKFGLKGTTIYREGSRNGILTISDKIVNQQIQRPKELPVDIHNVKIKGENWTVLVGLLYNKPYEIFTFKNKNVHLKDLKNPKLIKEESEKGNNNKYHLESDEIKIINLPEWYERGEEEFTTRLISRMMRQNYDLNIIINDAEKTNKSIGTFVNVLKRVLSTYTERRQSTDTCPECGETLIHEEGCAKCTCGYSKCG